MKMRAFRDSTAKGIIRNPFLTGDIRDLFYRKVGREAYLDLESPAAKRSRNIRARGLFFRRGYRNPVDDGEIKKI